MTSLKSKLTDLVPGNTIFVVGGLLVYGVVYWGIPRLNALGVEPLVAWMILSIPVVFLPIIFAGLWLLRTEDSGQMWMERLRLRRPTGRDWQWGLMGLVGVGIGSLLMVQLCAVWGLNINPPFARAVQALSVDRLWILGLWVIYWPINILGEELVWRGILLPRMEGRLGAGAWVFNAFLWGIFHFAFGIGNLLILLPNLILVPLIAQKRRNTWLAVLLHAGLSLLGFLALFSGQG